jgi:hypothetical protein
MKIFLTENLGTPAGDDLRFCASLEGEHDEDRAGFGPTEAAALTELARLTETDVDTAEIIYVGVR